MTRSGGAPGPRRFVVSGAAAYRAVIAIRTPTTLRTVRFRSHTVRHDAPSEGGTGDMMDLRRLLRVWVLIVAGALLAGPAVATMRFGPLTLSGNLQSQNIVRTPDVSDYQFIQNRNVARIQLVYDWLQG